MPLIKWEELKNEEVANTYRRRMGEELSVEQQVVGVATTGWAGVVG